MCGIRLHAQPSFVIFAVNVRVSMWSGVSSVPSAPMLLHCMALLLRVMAFTKVNANSHLELTALKATVTHEVDSGCDASFGYDTRTAITFSSATRAKHSVPVTLPRPCRNLFNPSGWRYPRSPGETF